MKDIEIARISPAQAQQILALDEGHFLDLKSIDIAPVKLTRSISAFANASGGEIYIGIEEQVEIEKKTRVWRGFADPEAANGHIQLFEQFFPLGQYYSYTFLASDDCPGLVLQININKTREITKASNDIVYLRRGAQNLPVATEDGLRRLKLDKGIHSFETETIDVQLVTITNSTPVLEFVLNVIPTVEPEEWLKKQELERVANELMV
jgi:ATP-dependent DNA helicase RecG